MRKLAAASLILFFVSATAATTISSERTVIDLENSEATVTVDIQELTSSGFTYISSADIQSVSATAEGEELDCDVQNRGLGDEIRCETDLRNNFTIEIDYTFENVASNNGQVETFTYSHPIYRPTENFMLRVKLPRGTGLVGENLSEAIEPTDGTTGSDGTQIFVEWSREPDLGTMTFNVRYEQLRTENNYIEIISAAVGLLAILGLLYYYWRRISREELDEIYGEISDDERDILELLRENEGEMLQKDVVNSSEYSKAKISGVVSELVEKGMVEKEKEGRSNKLKISSHYRY